jgi:hypothetical protein
MAKTMIGDLGTHRLPTISFEKGFGRHLSKNQMQQLRERLDQERALLLQRWWDDLIWPILSAGLLPSQAEPTALPLWEE